MKPEVSWEVRWPSRYALNGVTVVPRRDEELAKALTRSQRSNGHAAKLYRVEKTEVDF